MRRFSALLLGLCVLSPFACNHADPGAGSNTNWLRLCEGDADCPSELSCLCGVCTAPCEAECAGLPGALCAAPDSVQHREQCGQGQLAEVGLCLPACDSQEACAANQLCHEGSCIGLASDASDGCAPGAKLELSAGDLALEARYGTLFGDALYLPVAYEQEPVGWIEPMTPAPIVARVTDAQGAPLEGCAVRFVTGEGSGRAFSELASTDAAGEVTAYWVAGADRAQSLTAALVDHQGQVERQSLSGTAYANDEGPQDSSAAAIVVARPATLRLSYTPPDGASLVRVRVSAGSFPHHAFYAAMTSPGFFAGLQNTSELDALRDTVADVDHVLIASVWNVEPDDAELLFQVPDMSCTPHYQETGGIRCLLGGAWQTGVDYVLTLERTSLLNGEVGPGYLELGYPTTPCAGATGCTDYTLYYAAADEPELLQPVVAFRHQNADISPAFGSFVQPYVDASDQNSCLATPLYDATFEPSTLVDGEFVPLAAARFNAVYQSWHNEVCANYAVDSLSDGFRLVTGGPSVLGRPELPGDPARQLTLP